MLYPSMNDLLKKVPNRYSLVNVAAKRARDIADEAERNPDFELEDKPVSIALADIMEGRIVAVDAPASANDEYVFKPDTQNIDMLFEEE